MSAISVERQFTGMDTLIRFETGLLAPQAHGAVVAQLGNTMVLATATTNKQPKDGIDFFPLTVDVEERMYAAGKIPGSFFRREGRASDQAILTCRLIDRPLRPCFPDGFRNDVHVVVTILGADLINPHDVLAINASSAALMMSGIPFEGPIGAVRIALAADGRWIPFPTYQEGDESSFELVVAGRMTSDGSDVAVMMVEAGGTEFTWKAYEAKAAIPTEEVVAAGLVEAKRWIAESIALQQELLAKSTPREPMVWIPVKDYSDEIAELIGPEARLIEFGSGAGIKSRLLLSALQQPRAYVPVDISRAHLLAAAADLALDFPNLSISPVCADYTRPFALPPIHGTQPRTEVGFFPGSTIGNLTAMESRAFLARTRTQLGSGAVMVIGVDLLKDEDLLRAAYNDAEGVTAAFNLNLLRRINDELRGSFELSQFTHSSIWNPELGRIEMHLVSQCAQSVHIGSHRFDFEAGETIHTENSYKYGIEQFCQLAKEAGYRSLATWTDKQQLFSVHALKAM